MQLQADGDAGDTRQGEFYLQEQPQRIFFEGGKLRVLHLSFYPSCFCRAGVQGVLLSGVLVAVARQSSRDHGEGICPH